MIYATVYRVGKYHDMYADCMNFSGIIFYKEIHENSKSAFCYFVVPFLAYSGYLSISLITFPEGTWKYMVCNVKVSLQNATILCTCLAVSGISGR